MVFLIRPGLVLLLCAGTLMGCTQLLFQPMEAHVNDPETLGIEAEDVYLETDDGVRLHAWFLPAQNTPRRGSILFLHGNAENISTHLASVWWLPDYGFDVLLVDYRGYGRSEGHPTLAGVHADARAALQALLEREEVDAQRVAVFGQSLGGAVAINLVAQSSFRGQIGALIVEGVPTSFRARARELLGDWWLTWALQWPLSLSISDRYRPIDSVAAIAPVPLLIVHGAADTVIPLDHGRALYAAAQEPKHLWVVPDARHIQAFLEPQWRERLVKYLGQTLAAPQPSADEDPANAGDAEAAPRGGSPSQSADRVQ